MWFRVVTMDTATIMKFLIPTVLRYRSSGVCLIHFRCFFVLVGSNLALSVTGLANALCLLKHRKVVWPS